MDLDAFRVAASPWARQMCGPGGKYNTMPDERVAIPDFLDMIKIYLLAILDICGTD